MEAHLTCVLNGVARSMAPGGLKKALSFEPEVGLTGTSATATLSRGQVW